MSFCIWLFSLCMKKSKIKSLSSALFRSTRPRNIFESEDCAIQSIPYMTFSAIQCIHHVFSHTRDLLREPQSFCRLYRFIYVCILHRRYMCKTFTHTHTPQRSVRPMMIMIFRLLNNIDTDFPIENVQIKYKHKHRMCTVNKQTPSPYTCLRFYSITLQKHV